jgi:hypothetical protein
MRIDYCPECHKAGLKYQRYPDSPYSNPPLILTLEQKIENERYHHDNAKWCPRCKEWVKPENHEWSRGK